MFIVSLTYIVPLEKIELALNDHRNFLRKHYDNHTFLMSGPKNPRDGGVILMNAGSLEEVRAIIKEDPFWQQKLAEYQITEFHPTMTHESLALFLKV